MRDAVVVRPPYPDAMSLREKIETVARRVYGADGIDLAPAAQRALAACEADGLGRLPVCIAKTHLSISHDPSLLGAPTGWRLPVRDARAFVGAGFVTVYCGDVRTMPGLGKAPAAFGIGLADDGSVTGLS